MRKIVNNNYILSVGNKGSGLSEAEYALILDALKNKPEKTNEYGYRLTTDLSWERYELVGGGL